MSRWNFDQCNKSLRRPNFWIFVKFLKNCCLNNLLKSQNLWIHISRFPTKNPSSLKSKVLEQIFSLVIWTNRSDFTWLSNSNFLWSAVTLFHRSPIPAAWFRPKFHRSKPGNALFALPVHTFASKKILFKVRTELFKSVFTNYVIVLKECYSSIVYQRRKSKIIVFQKKRDSFKLPRLPLLCPLRIHRTLPVHNSPTHCQIDSCRCRRLSWRKC